VITNTTLGGSDVSESETMEGAVTAARRMNGPFMAGSTPVALAAVGHAVAGTNVTVHQIAWCVPVLKPRMLRTRV
jgi:hypothetical protein